MSPAASLADPFLAAANSARLRQQLASPIQALRTFNTTIKHRPIAAIGEMPGGAAALIVRRLLFDGWPVNPLDPFVAGELPDPEGQQARRASAHGRTRVFL